MEKNRGGPLKKDISQVQSRSVQGELYPRENEESCLAHRCLHQPLLCLLSFCTAPLTPAAHLNPYCLTQLQSGILDMLMGFCISSSFAVFTIISN